MKDMVLRLHPMIALQNEIRLSGSDKAGEETRPLPSADDYAPNKYSFRTSAALTVKLLIIATSVFVLLWMASSPGARIAGEEQVAGAREKEELAAKSIHAVN